MFDVTVSSEGGDNLIEWEECIVVVITDLLKDNVMIDSSNNQAKVTIDDQDSKFRSKSIVTSGISKQPPCGCVYIE